MTPAPRGPKHSPIQPQALLEAAQAVFAREGIQGASIRAIAREAGCDPALIYYHFDNKEAIFSALLERKFAALAPAIRQAAALDQPGDLQAKLRALLMVFKAHLAQDCGFRAMIRGHLVQGAEPVKDLLATKIHPIFQVLVELLSQGVATGRLRANLPVPIAAFFFIRTYMEVLDLIPTFSERFAHLPATEALAQAEEAWLEFFWRGATAQEPSP